MARMGVWGKGQPTLAPPQHAETPERGQRFGLPVGDGYARHRRHWTLNEITRFIAELAGCAFIAPELRARVKRSFLEVQ